MTTATTPTKTTTTAANTIAGMNGSSDIVTGCMPMFDDGYDVFFNGEHAARGFTLVDAIAKGVCEVDPFDIGVVTYLPFSGGDLMAITQRGGIQVL